MSRIMNPRDQHRDALPMHPPVGRVMRVDTTPAVRELERVQRHITVASQDEDIARVLRLLRGPVSYPDHD